MRVTMEVFPEKLKYVWNKVELRSAILVSLAIQIILILLASSRKRYRSYLLRATLWLAYLLSDSIAIFALGHISETQGEKKNNDLIGFWSPFLLLHLGGPDTITAFSLEDNELWRRHLLTLAVQFLLAVYSFIRCLTTTRLVASACLVLLAGVIKDGERIWALRYASKDHFKEAQLSLIDGEKSQLPLKDGEKSQPPLKDEEKSRTEDQDISEEEVLDEAYRFFKTFQRLIVNLIFSLDELRESKTFFFKRSSEQIFKVIGIELNFFYDVLYTKAVIFHSSWGSILPLITFISILLALFLFLFSTDKNGYDPSGIIISYILLGGALIIEIYAFSRMILSDLTMVWLINRKCDWFLVAFRRAFFFFHSPKRARWSNSIGQYNLIRFCVADQSQTPWKSIIKIFSVKKLWDKHYYTEFISVTPALREFICGELKDKAINCREPREYKHLYRQRGEWLLKKLGYSDTLPRMGVDIDVLNRSLEGEFDESILIWHIATDMCYHAGKPNGYTSDDEISQSPHQTVLSGLSKYISDYMIYLLVNLPDMVVAGIGDLRFRDTCAEINDLLNQERDLINQERGITNEVHASEILVRKRRSARKDKNKSVLYKAGELAAQLQNIQPEIEWKIISHVWVEMLSYAAGHCGGYIHAQQLSSGGELLTLVWLLMSHLGIVAEYRSEDEHTNGVGQ